MEFGNHFRWFYRFVALGTATFFVVTATAKLPDGVSLKPYLQPSGTVFQAPISFLEIPGSAGAFVVVEKAGRVVYYEPKTGKSWEWSKISVNTFAEEGLYSVAFHPDFVNNGRYYAFYNPSSNPTSGAMENRGKFAIVLAEFKADAKRERDSGEQPKIIHNFCCKENGGHNGMAMVFGTDGMLYLSIGDGNTNGKDTQSRKSILGTVLRINVDNPDPGRNYGIPTDNPYFNDPDPKVLKEIWSYGFRVPFKMMMDPLNGELWVGNVGGWLPDYVIKIGKAVNSGWPITEATYCWNEAPAGTHKPPLPDCDRTGITPANFSLPREQPFRNANTNSVTGLYIHRANPQSEFYGALFVGDYQSRQFYGVRLDANGSLEEIKEYKIPTSVRPIHIAAASDGRVLVLEHGPRTAPWGVNQFYYLDHPQLLLPPLTAGIGRKRSALPPAIYEKVKNIYDVSGKRLNPAKTGTLDGVSTWTVPVEVK